jgi:TusA-related sulfurtransferase
MKASSVTTAGTPSAEKAAGRTGRGPDEILDLRGMKCPMNLLRVKLALEPMQDGATLQVIIDTGEPVRSIPHAAKEEGHKIIEAERLDSDSFSLLIEKGGRG